MYLVLTIRVLNIKEKNGSINVLYKHITNTVYLIRNWQLDYSECIP